LIENSDQLLRRMWHYPCGELMVQEYLPAVEDFRVMVIGYHALPVMISRKPPRGDFRTNYSVGGRFTGHNLEQYPGFKELGEAAAHALQREFTGVDIRMRGDEPVVLEVNRQPDFEGFERATKYDVASQVVRYIQERLKA
jgi:glutathione synthase/RimK-type ligase-like ATP-grasp enzyme